MRDYSLLALLLTASALLLLSAQFLSQESQAGKISSANSPIKHVIVIIQENHAFDNYFGTYPGADGIPNGACVPYNPATPWTGCVKPWLTTNSSQPSVAALWRTSSVAYDNGAMDGFVAAANGSATPISYYDNEAIPNYWDYARHYVLADRFFSSALGSSLPNHWYSIAANAPNASFYPINTSISMLIKQEYLREANQTPAIDSLLDSGNITWKYYDTPFGTDFANSVILGSVYSLWNPFEAKPSSYTPQELGHFVPRAEIFSDLANGTLPQVSWVVPNYVLSEHPPSNVTLGMWYVTYIVDSVMQSRYWNSTAIIITWDDYGGYYDHVVPPRADRNGLSFRVPALIISPYAKKGYVDHTTYSFPSTLAFIEWNFGLGHLNWLDSSSNDMLNAFNFSQAPQGPDIIPISDSQKALISQILQYYRYESFSEPRVIVNGVLVNSSDFDT